MYESHFGFRRKPFRAATAQSQYFGSTGLQRVLGPISYCLRTGQGIALLTAPAGLGKSTVLRHLVRTLEGSGKVVLLPGLQAQTPEGLLSAIASGVASEPQKSDWKPPERTGEAGLRDRVVAVCQRAAELWGPTVVLIDDAHVVCDDVFHELRFLADCLDDDQPLFRIGLAGTLKLEEKLTSPALSDFGQRVRCHQFLETLRPEESIEYLKWHIESVGGKLEHAFEDPAVEFIVVAADGVPRCLNQLADESLLLAYYANRTIVDLAIARTALESLRHLPLEWSDPEPELSADVGGETRDESDSIIEIAGLGDAGHRSATQADARTDAVDTSADVSSQSDTNTTGSHSRDEDTESGTVSVLEFGDSGLQEDTIAVNPADDGIADQDFGGEEIGDDAEFANSIDLVSANFDDAIDAAVTNELTDELADDDCEADTVESAAFSEALEDDRARLEELLAEDEGSQSELAGPRFVVSVPESWEENRTQHTTAGRDEHVSPMTLEQTNSVPVFDRYTWNALEREVPAGSPRTATDLQIPPSTWPPVTSGNGSGAAILISDAAIDDHSEFVTRDRPTEVSDPVDSRTDCESEFCTEHDDVIADSVAETATESSDLSVTQSERITEASSGNAGYPSSDWAVAATSSAEPEQNRDEQVAPSAPEPLDAEVDEATAATIDQSSVVTLPLGESSSEAARTVPVFGTEWSDSFDVIDADAESTESDLQPEPDESDGDASGPDVDRSFFTLSMMVSTLEASESENSPRGPSQSGESRVTAKSSEEFAAGVFSTPESAQPREEWHPGTDAETLNPATESENAGTRQFRLRQDSVLSENDRPHPLHDNSHVRSPGQAPPDDMFSDLFTRIIGRGHPDHS